VVILLVVSRAPVLAAIPLLTVVVAIEASLPLLAPLSEATDLNLYQGTRLCVTVVSYGVGVDYCLFLIARRNEVWKSRVGAGSGVSEAVPGGGRNSARKVGTTGRRDAFTYRRLDGTEHLREDRGL
jgi:RND superfamily putative drug exporter